MARGTIQRSTLTIGTKKYICFKYVLSDCLLNKTCSNIRIWDLDINKSKWTKIKNIRVENIKKVFGPVQDENWIWRIRKNPELNELAGNADIVRFIKRRRMAWLVHVMRMDGGIMPRRILEWKPMGRRIRGRPRKRWIEDAEEDIQTKGIRGWRKLIKERTEWKKIAEKAKTHSGL